MQGIETWLQLATSTGFVGLAWYLIVVALPREREQFMTFARDQLKTFESQIARIMNGHENVVKDMLDRHEKLVAVLTNRDNKG